MKRILIAVLIFFITISAVSAENETDLSFSDLQSLIDNSETGEISLTDDYKFSSADKGAVEISKSVTVNGNNHTLDGNHASQILHIDSSGENKMKVILKDIIFINGNSKSSGGAVYAGVWNDGRISIVNCIFINNTAGSEGGAVAMLESNIDGCTFINNTAPMGGAVSQFFSTIDHSTFIGNSAEYGGAVFQEGKSVVNNSKFSYNTAKFSGGAVYQTDLLVYDKPITENSEFDHNSAQYGGAIFSEHGIVRNCSFENNTASVEGDDVYEYADPFMDDVPNALESDYDHVHAEKFKKETTSNQTGNPLMLLLAAFAIPILRNRD